MVDRIGVLVILALNLPGIVNTVDAIAPVDIRGWLMRIPYPPEILVNILG